MALAVRKLRIIIIVGEVLSKTEFTLIQYMCKCCVVSGIHRLPKKRADTDGRSESGESGSQSTGRRTDTRRLRARRLVSSRWHRRWNGLPTRRTMLVVMATSSLQLHRRLSWTVLWNVFVSSHVYCFNGRIKKTAKLHNTKWYCKVHD